MPFLRTACPLAWAVTVVVAGAAALGADVHRLQAFLLVGSLTVLTVGSIGALRHWRRLGLVFVLEVAPLAAVVFTDRLPPAWAVGLLAVLLLAHGLRAEPDPHPCPAVRALRAGRDDAAARTEAQARRARRVLRSENTPATSVSATPSPAAKR